jgi:hypothetical protein
VFDLSRSLPMGPPVPPSASVPPGAPAVASPSLPVPAASESGLPNGVDLPPVFRLASIDADNQFVLKAVHALETTSTQYVTKQELKIVDGKEIAVQVCVPISVTEKRQTSQTTILSTSAVSVVTVANEPFDDRHREALRQREIPVVVSPNGSHTKTFWLQNIRPRMLVVAIPPISSTGAHFTPSSTQPAR